LFVVGVGKSAFEIYRAEDRPREVVRQVGGWAGAVGGGWAGSKVGMAGGAAAGSFVAGAGAAPGAVIGGIGGAIFGGASGWWAGTTITERVYDVAFRPATKEEWVIVMCGDRPLQQSDTR